MHLTNAGFPSGIPGMGELIEGKIQHAAQPGRHSIISEYMPAKVRHYPETGQGLARNPEFLFLSMPDLPEHSAAIMFLTFKRRGFGLLLFIILLRHLQGFRLFFRGFFVR